MKASTITRQSRSKRSHCGKNSVSCMTPRCHANADARERERKRGRERRQQQAFREHARDETPPTRAERDAHREIVRAAERARHHEVDRVRARDEQHEHDRREHRAERAARRTIGRHACERLDEEASAAETLGIGARGVGEPGVERVRNVRVARVRVAACDDPVGV